MKKRLLSALLALALVFVLLPTTALADTTPVTDENVKINGTAVTVGNDISLGEGNGTYSYDKSTRTLTLNNATITATGSNIGIDFCDTTNYVTYSVILTGENTVTSNNIAIETTPNTNLTFTGGGNLKAITNGYYQAIRVYGTLTIDNSTLIAESSAYTATTVIWTLAMTGNNAKLEISNKSAANIVAGTAGPASKNIDWSNYQFTTGSYSGDALTESDPEVCSWGTLNEYLGFPTKKYSQYICIAKRTIPALQRTSDVLIAGENAVVGVETSIPSANGSGTYFYDQASKTLTLKDVNIASSSIINGIQFTKEGTYTINLVGTNTMSGFSTGISANSADQYVSNINITITGAGSLEVSTTSYAIAMNKGNLKFENTGEIKLTTSNPSKNRNVLSVSGNITITDMDKYSVTGITQTGNPNVTGDTVTLSAASHLKGYQNPDDTWTYLKTITIASKPSETYYNDKAMKYGETRTAGSGTISCDENGAITLNGATAGTLEFRSSADSTLVLEGTSTLSSIVTTQKGLTISGSGSLTVGSIRVPNNTTTSNSPSLTIDGAKVTAGTPTSTTSAVEVKGDLTVTNGSLTATSTSDSVPTVQVGGNASFTGSTVTITNNSTTQGEQYEDSNAASSALHVNGAVTISGGTVMAEAKAGGNAIRAVGNITVSNGATVTAKNNSQYFNAITAGKATGGEVNTLYNLIVSGENTRITATNTHDNNLTYGGAINAYIKNANEGHYLQVGTDTKAIAPNVNTTVKNNSLTITRGDEVVRTPSPVVIAGTTLLNDTYYTITNGSTVAEGTDSNYNAFYDSETKTLKLNDAQISTTTNNAAIKISEDLTITVTGTNELKGNYNHCIESYNNFTINGTGTLNMTNTSSSSSAASVIYCGPYKRLTIAAEVIIKNEAQPGNLIFTVEKDAYSFAEGYNVYASTDVSGSPLETYDAAKSSTYKYLRVTKENLAPTTPTTYTVTITAGDNMKRESGALTQEVTKGAAITEVKFMAASGHYFPADYVSKMNLPAGLTAEIRENSWYLIISGTPTSDVTINLPAASVRPTITVSMPTPVAGYTPATASDITLTYSDINKSISKNLTISNVVWQSYVSNGDGSITPGNTLSSGDKFEAGKTYFVRITHEYVAGKYDIVPAAGITLDYTESDSTDMMLLFYTTGAPCNHEYTNDWHANGNTHWHECKLCRAHADEVAHTFGDWITDTPATDTTDGSKHRTCSVCQYKENATIPKTGTGEIVPPTPDNPGTIVIIRPAEEEKPAQQPNPSTGANDLVGLAVAAAVAAALGSAALLRKHD